MSDAPIPRKSAWIPWIFVAGMGVVVVVNGILAWFALSTWTGIETESHFTKGLAYNENLRGVERQAALGWSVTLTLTPTTAHSAPAPFDLKVQYLAADARPLSGLRVRADLIRPVHEGYDQTMELTATAPGHYQGRIEVPLAGQWDVLLAAIDGAGNHHQWRERVQVP